MQFVVALAFSFSHFSFCVSRFPFAFRISHFAFPVRRSLNSEEEKAGDLNVLLAILIIAVQDNQELMDVILTMSKM